MPEDILSLVRAGLKQQADPAVAAASRRFFKEPITAYGIKNPAVEKLARLYFPKVKPLGKQAVFQLCEELWQSGYIEESFIACAWAYRFNNEYEPDDFRTFERWVSKYVTNWAACDTLCNHTIAALVEKYPQFLADLKRSLPVTASSSTISFLSPILFLPTPMTSFRKATAGCSKKPASSTRLKSSTML